MANLLHGKFTDTPIATLNEKGEFKRSDTSFREEPSEIASGRYELFVSYACPWAHRTLIMRALKGLESHISVRVSDPYMGDKGWVFRDAKDLLYLAELYVAANSDYSGKITVPVFWDKKNNSIINNESSEIIRFLNTHFDSLTGNRMDFYPAPYRDEIERINKIVYPNINNGVYKTGFASNQEAYEKNFRNLFAALEEIESILRDRTFLTGEYFTEADIRLFTTLIRFDPVYYVHFKCNKKRIADYPNLFDYLRCIYQDPRVRATCNFDHIKSHYYGSHRFLNPQGIIPLGPELDSLETPHHRGELKIFLKGV